MKIKKVKLMLWQVLKREGIKSLRCRNKNEALWFKEILEGYGYEVTRAVGKSLIARGDCHKIPAKTGSQTLKEKLWFLANIHIRNVYSFELLPGFDDWDNLNNPEVNPFKWRLLKGVVTIYNQVENDRKKLKVRESKITLQRALADVACSTEGGLIALYKKDTLDKIIWTLKCFKFNFKQVGNTIIVGNPDNGHITRVSLEVLAGELKGIPGISIPNTREIWFEENACVEQICAILDDLGIFYKIYPKFIKIYLEV